jgi:hypothetical protein
MLRSSEGEGAQSKAGADSNRHTGLYRRRFMGILPDSRSREGKPSGSEEESQSLGYLPLKKAIHGYEGNAPKR